jgi:CheY-like chemotaxis protein
MIAPRILIVDDESRISSLMSIVLRRVGYEVREENRSFAALATAREFRPHLVLLDVDMPGKDGGMVAAELTADPIVGNTPYIFVTSLVKRNELGGSGKARYLSKPVEPVTLVAAVEQLLSQGTVSAEAKYASR